MIWVPAPEFTGFYFIQLPGVPSVQREGVRCCNWNCNPKCDCSSYLIKLTQVLREWGHRNLGGQPATKHLESQQDHIHHTDASTAVFSFLLVPIKITTLLKTPPPAAVETHNLEYFNAGILDHQKWLKVIHDTSHWFSEYLPCLGSWLITKNCCSNQYPFCILGSRNSMEYLCGRGSKWNWFSLRERGIKIIFEGFLRSWTEIVMTLIKRRFNTHVNGMKISFWLITVKPFGG